MKGPQEQYTDEMKNYFGYYAIWNPGVPLKLGDIGIFNDNAFTRWSNLSDKNIDFKIVEDQTPTDLEYSSRGSVSLTTKLSGVVSPQGSTLANADAGIIVEFSKENSTMFKAKNTYTNYVNNAIEIGEKVLDMFQSGKWDKKWVVITELVSAESASILISNKSNGKIELKVNANVNTARLDIADAKLEFSTQFSRGLDTNIIAQKGLTPLFKVMGIKTRMFIPPRFESRIRALDLITPENAKEYKDKIYFGYMNNDERE